MRIQKNLLFAAFSVAVLSTVFFAKPTFAAETEKNSIVVTGEGIVTVNPDKAVLHFGVETIDTTAKAAQNKNVQIVENAIAELKKIGIAEKDIKTSRYSVYPQYKYNDSTEERILTGYRVNNNFEVTTKNVDNTGIIMDAAMKAGVTTNNGVYFSVENPNQYYAQALKLAVENSKQSANVIAQTLGTTIKETINVTEMGNRNSYLKESYSEGISAAMARDADTSAIPDIRYDKIEISAFITATYTY